MSEGLVRLGGEIKTRSQTSCPSNMFSPLYHPFLFSLSLLLGPVQTLWYWHFGTVSRQLVVILRWATSLAMDHASSNPFLAFSWLHCLLLPPGRGKAGKRKSKAYMCQSSIYLCSSGKNGKGNRKPQLKGSFWMVCVWFSAIPHHHHNCWESGAFGALNWSWSFMRGGGEGW